MANLGNNQLINKTASLAMQGLMQNSWAGQPEALGKTNRVYGKVGIQPNHVSYDDCAIVERHCMRYSMTVLFIPGGIQYGLFTELDAIADELFGLSREICEIGHKLATKIQFF